MQIWILVCNSWSVSTSNFNANKEKRPTLAHQLFPDTEGSCKILFLLQVRV